MKNVWLALLLFCSALSAADVELVPVIDGGSFFTPAEAQAAASTFEKLSKDTGKVVRIETFARVPDALMNQLGQEGKDQFFQHWIFERAGSSGTGNAFADVFVLICKAPSHLRVLVAPNLQKKGFDNDKRDEFANNLLTKFKAKQYDAGLQEFTTNVDKYVRGLIAAAELASPKQAPLPPPGSFPFPSVATAPPVAETSYFWIWVMLGVLVFLVIVLVIVSASKKKRPEDTDTPVDLEPQQERVIFVPPPPATVKMPGIRRVIVDEPPPIVVRQTSVVIVEEDDPPLPLYVPIPMPDPDPDPPPTYSPPAPGPDPAPSYTPDPDPPSSSDSSSSSSDSGSSGGDFGSSDSGSSSSDSGSSGGDF